jgi:hypothetical protein
MRRMQSLLLLLGSIVALAGGPPAGAIDSLNGPYGEVRWTAAFYEAGIGPIDRVQVDWLAGAGFAPPYFMNFDIHDLAGQLIDPGGWTTDAGGAHSAGAHSPDPADWLSFELVFEPPHADPLSFTFRAFADDVVRDQARVEWDGAAWRFVPIGACCVNGVCMLVTESECLDLAGSFQGLLTGCDAGPCAATPVENGSWGRLKTLFR